MNGIVAGAAVPHAPQFFSLPSTEDHDLVERVRVIMHDVGQRLLALEPDVIVIAANDHLENFFMHCTPAFTVHCGTKVAGRFAGHDFAWPSGGDLGRELVVALQEEDFDPAFSYTSPIGYEFGIPLTFCGIPDDFPLLPIYVNTYVPPQPSSDRCYSFGRALDRALRLMGVRAVMLASGGMSHLPGTERYSTPSVDWDRALLEKLKTGNLRSLLSHNDQMADDNGEGELRTWQILAGALGERVPDVVACEPSWHHVYGVVGFTTETKPAPPSMHYPPVSAERLALYDALYKLRMDEEARVRFIADPPAYADQYDLTAEEREALVNLDEAAVRELGLHAMIGFLARLQVDITRRSQ